MLTIYPDEKQETPYCVEFRTGENGEEDYILWFRNFVPPEFRDQWPTILSPMMILAQLAEGKVNSKDPYRLNSKLYLKFLVDSMNKDHTEMEINRPI